MVNKNIAKLSKSLVEVSITVAWSDIEQIWNETLTRMAQEVEISGFRKGQAPLNLVEQNLGTKLSDEVFKTVMPKALIEALQGENIVPIDYPKYQVVMFQKGGNLQFKARITERPAISVNNYKSIKVQRPQLKQVTEEDVSKIVDDLFKRWKTRQELQKSAAGGSSAGQPAGTVSQQVGQAAQGQNTSGSLNFNTSSVRSDAASSGGSDTGGPDDNFAKTVGAENLLDLKAKLRQDLENEAKYNNDLDFEEAILQEVEKVTVVEIPEVLVNDELNRMLVSLQRSVTERGLLLDEYLKAQKKDVEQLKKEWTPQAEKNVRMELGLSEIAKFEGINISDEELQTEIDKIQDGRIKAQFAAPEPKMHLRHALRQTKTLNFLKTLVGGANP